jgi:hypothetical protein
MRAAADAEGCTAVALPFVSGQKVSGDGTSTELIRFRTLFELTRRTWWKTQRHLGAARQNADAQIAA